MDLRTGTGIGKSGVDDTAERFGHVIAVAGAACMVICIPGGPVAVLVGAAMCLGGMALAALNPLIAGVRGPFSREVGAAGCAGPGMGV